MGACSPGRAGLRTWTRADLPHRPHTDSLTVPLISTTPAPLSPYPYQTPGPVPPQGLCRAVPAEPPRPSLLQGLLSCFTQNLAQMSPPLRGCHPHLPGQPLPGRSPSPCLLGFPAAPPRCRETRWAAPTGRCCGIQSRATGGCQDAAGPSPRGGASARGGGAAWCRGWGRPSGTRSNKMTREEADREPGAAPARSQLAGTTWLGLGPATQASDRWSGGSEGRLHTPDSGTGDPQAWPSGPGQRGGTQAMPEILPG